MRVNRPFGPWVASTAIDQHARLRLFCLPYAGGAASIYRTWESGLPDDVQVCPIQLPGREERMAEAPVSRIREVANLLATELQPHLGVPFALFGHSMGTLIVFELARALRGIGAPTPVHLFLSAYRAPQIPRTKPPIHNLPQAEFLDELRRLQGMPKEVLDDAELMEFVLPLIRSDFEAIETYEYVEEAPFDVPLSVFGGEDDSDFSYDELEAWRKQTQGVMTLRMFPGNHFFIHAMREPLLQAIAQDLRDFLRY